MNTRAIRAARILAAGSLLLASTAGASGPIKRYTLPAGVDPSIDPHGSLTVLLPAEWHVKRSIPSAADPVHKTVAWTVYTRAEPKGTTLADIRSHDSFRGWGCLWSCDNKYRVVGDSYVTLPVGKAWRLSTLSVGSKKGDWQERQYARMYLVHRGVTHDAATGGEKELFIAFRVSCGYRPSGTRAVNECQTHNGQLDAIMRSIRFLP